MKSKHKIISTVVLVVVGWRLIAISVDYFGAPKNSGNPLVAEIIRDDQGHIHETVPIDKYKITYPDGRVSYIERPDGKNIRESWDNYQKSLRRDVKE
jgi:hypothetical protein